LKGLASIATTVIIVEEQLRIPQVLEFSAEAEAHYADLKRQRVNIGAQDLKIASVALAVSGTVVTRNRRDFGKVPGLFIEDWSL
jgi:tRNA(fMet)-specific endonuclease VapC